MLNCRIKRDGRPYVTFFLVILYVFCSLVIPASASAHANYPFSDQQEGGSLGGKITDKKGGGLAGVSVSLVGASNESKSSDNEGSYRFSNLAEGSYTVSYTSVGFAPVTRLVVIKAGVRTTLNITLSQAAKDMDQVVVVGYGVQKKATVTGAISSISTSDLLKSPTANISNALVGRMPGLLANQASGIPGGDGATLRIRGIGTFAGGTSADPLIMIDGVENSTFNNLDPNEVESISILKDASATAVYGLRGANGVILITTRRGKTGAAEVTLSTSFAKTRFLSKYQVFDAYDYANKFNDAYRYDSYLTGSYVPVFSAADIEKYRTGSDPLFYPNTNWIDLMEGNSAPQSTNNLNIRGGTDRVKYFISLGYLTQDGLLKNMDLSGLDGSFKYKRYNIRTNLDFNVTKRLTANVSLFSSFENQLGDIAALGNYLSELYKNAPMVGSLTSDGKIILNSVNGNYNWTGNPLIFQNQRGKRDNYKNNITADINLNYALDFVTEGLSAHFKINYQNYLSNTTAFSRNLIYYKPARDANGNVTYIPQEEEGSYGTGAEFQKTRKTYEEFGLDYARRFGYHNVTAKVLYNQGKLFDPGLAFQVPNGLQGVIGRVTYDWSGKYLVEFDGQYNGTENFGPGKRYGFFPSVSGGWIPSMEKFFPRNSAVSFLKIRGSFGQVGNDKVGGSRFLYLPSAYLLNRDGGPNLPSYRFGEVGSTQALYAASYESRIGNPDLTWERANKANLGVNLNMFRDKLRFTADVFREIRNNILAQPQTIPATFGGTSIDVPDNGIVINNLPSYNLGKMQNKGFDAELAYANQIGNVQYSVSANYSFTRNKILFQDEAKRPFSYQNRTGQAYNQFFGLIAEGFYNSWEEVNDANRPVYIWNNNRIQPGDIKYRDINGDGKINDDDQVPIGFSNFPLQIFGVNLQGQWKGFSVSVLFQGARDVSLRSSKQSYRTFQENGNSPTFFEESWSLERYNAGLPISFPHLSTVKDQVSNYQSSTYLIRSANYVRLKNAEVAYTFKNSFLKRMHVSATRIYASGTNLILWSNQLRGQDPENASPPDGNNEVYPAVQIFNLGLNVTF